MAKRGMRMIAVDSADIEEVIAALPRCTHATGEGLCGAPATRRGEVRRDFGSRAGRWVGTDFPARWCEAHAKLATAWLVAHEAAEASSKTCTIEWRLKVYPYRAALLRLTRGSGG